jgi:hypothetical protein
MVEDTAQLHCRKSGHEYSKVKQRITIVLHLPKTLFTRAIAFVA